MSVKQFPVPATGVFRVMLWDFLSRECQDFQRPKHSWGFPKTFCTFLSPFSKLCFAKHNAVISTFLLRMREFRKCFIIWKEVFFILFYFFPLVQVYFAWSWMSAAQIVCHVLINTLQFSILFLRLQFYKLYSLIQ